MAEIPELATHNLYKNITELIKFTTHITSSIYTYAAELKRVPAYIQILIDEFRSLGKTLMILQRSLSTSSSVIIQSRLQQLNDLNKKTNECLQRLTSKLRPVNIPWFAGTARRSKWLPNLKETLHYTSNIQDLRDLYLSSTITSSRLPCLDHREGILPKTSSTAKLHDLRVESPILSSLNTEDVTMDIEWGLKQVFSWLCRDDRQRHLDISRQRLTKIGNWILRDMTYQKWIQQREIRLVWGYGIPGAGKTFLNSLIIDDLQSQASAKNFGIAYIYFNYADQEQQEAIYVLASLIEQLSYQHPDVSRKIEILYSELYMKERKPKPSIQELYSILIGASRYFNQVFLLFDALDECDPSRRKFLLPLFRRMNKDGFKIFLTSRPYAEDIKSSLQLATKIEISGNMEDVGMYIQHRIEEDPRAKRLLSRSNFRDQIVSHLVEGSRGVFLWVKLQLTHICQQTTAKQMLFALEKIRGEKSPSMERPLDPSYDRAMVTIYNQQKSSVDLAAKVFSWLTRARRPLTLDELRIAVSVKSNKYRLIESDLPDRAKLLEVCNSLVTIGECSNTIRLTHYTVLEYLLRNPILASSGDPAHELALACTTYLSFDIFHLGVSSGESRQGLCPFFRYAAYYLSSHVKSYDEDTSTAGSIILSLAILKFLVNSGNVAAYLNYLYTQKKQYNGFVSERAFWNSHRGEYLRLHVATSIGNLSVVQLLLEGANLKIENNNGWKVLSLAKKTQGHEFVDQLLLTRNNQDIFERDDLGQTALHIAASEGHIDIVQLLLNKGLSPSSPDKEGKTPLHVAAFAGHESVVRTLLEYQANLLPLDTNWNSALCWAVSRGYQSVIKALIDNGAKTSGTISDEEWAGEEWIGEEWIMVPSPAEINKAIAQTLSWNYPDDEIYVHQEPTAEQCRALTIMPYAGNYLPPTFEADRWRLQPEDDPSCNSAPSFVSNYSTPRAQTQDSNSVDTHHIDYDGQEEDLYITEEGEDYSVQDSSSSFSNSSAPSSNWGIICYANGGTDKGKRKAADSKSETISLGVSGNGPDDMLGRKRRKKDGVPMVKSSSNGISGSSRPYACPFHKNNAQAYSSCGTWKNTEIHRVKEHCKRAHIKPLQCPRCGFRTGDNGQIKNHLGDPKIDCAKNYNVIPVGSDDESRAKALERRCLDWEAIYRILFPGCPMPSPYWQEPPLAVVAPVIETSRSSSAQQADPNLGFISWLGANMPILYTIYLQDPNRPVQLPINPEREAIGSSETLDPESYEASSSGNIPSQVQQTFFQDYPASQTYNVGVVNDQEEAITNNDQNARDANVPHYSGGNRTASAFNIDTYNGLADAISDIDRNESEASTSQYGWLPGAGWQGFT